MDLIHPRSVEPDLSTPEKMGISNIWDILTVLSVKTLRGQLRRLEDIGRRERERERERERRSISNVSSRDEERIVSEAFLFHV